MHDFTLVDLDMIPGSERCNNNLCLDVLYDIDEEDLLNVDLLNYHDQTQKFSGVLDNPSHGAKLESKENSIGFTNIR